MKKSKDLKISEATRQNLRDLIASAVRDIEYIAEVANLSSIRVSIDHTPGINLGAKTGVKVDLMKMEDITMYFDEKGIEVKTSEPRGSN